jgi:hypothetical protein
MKRDREKLQFNFLGRWFMKNCLFYLMMLICIFFTGNSYANNSSNSIGPVIQGLSVGMPIQNAHARLQELFKDDWKISAIEKQDDGHLFFRCEEKQTPNFMPETLLVWADPKSKNVIQIKFSESAVNYLFNVTDMNGQEFTQAFVDAYSIPSMEYKIKETDPFVQAMFADNPYANTGPKGYWEYKDPQGVLVSITESKVITISKIASNKERNFN